MIDKIVYYINNVVDTPTSDFTGNVADVEVNNDNLMWEKIIVFLLFIVIILLIISIMKKNDKNESR